MSSSTACTTSTGTGSAWNRFTALRLRTRPENPEPSVPDCQRRITAAGARERPHRNSISFQMAAIRHEPTHLPRFPNGESGRATQHTSGRRAAEEEVMRSDLLRRCCPPRLPWTRCEQYRAHCLPGVAVPTWATAAQCATLGRKSIWGAAGFAATLCVCPRRHPMDWLSTSGLTPLSGMAAKKRPTRCSVLTFRSVAGPARPATARETPRHRSPAPRAHRTASVHIVSEQSQCSACQRQDQAISALASAVNRLADRVETLAASPPHTVAAPGNEPMRGGKRSACSVDGEAQCSICLLELEEGQVFVMCV